MEEQNTTQPNITSLSNEVPDQLEQIAEEDKKQLDLAQARKTTAQMEAKAAVLAAEKAELEHYNLVLQIYLKSGLSIEDGISPDGKIHRGARKQQMQQEQITQQPTSK